MNYVGAQPLTQCGFCAPSFDVALLLVRHLHWTAVALPPLALAQGIWRADYHTGGGSKRSSWRPAKFTVALLAKIPGFIFSLGKTESRTRLKRRLVRIYCYKYLDLRSTVDLTPRWSKFVANHLPARWRPILKRYIRNFQSAFILLEPDKFLMMSLASIK